MNTILAASIGLLALGAQSGADLMAQDATPNRAQKANARIYEAPVISLDFAGGSLAKFAAALRKAGDDVNIVVPTLATEVDLPAITLSQTTVESALRAIGAVVGNEFQVRVETLVSRVGKPVYAVSIRQMKTNMAGATTTAHLGVEPTNVVVLSLKFLTSNLPGDVEDDRLTLKAETILTAVDTGLGIHEGINKPEFRYHEDSGLLFVKGLSRELGLVREIVHNLDGDMRRLRDALRMEAMVKQQAAANKALQARQAKQAAQGK